MALILCIDTATEQAFVSLQEAGQSLGCIYNAVQKDHATFLHPAIQKLLLQNDKTAADLTAVAVSNGPGSYTGLRVSLATAKGLCFALQIPLICISTLRIMAAAAIEANFDENLLYCPMIDARRMEVFTAIYDANLKEVLAPAALVLGPDSLAAFLSQKRICFMGNGMEKWKAIQAHKNASFTENLHIPAAMNRLALSAFEAGNFAGLALANPYYIKPFHDGY